MKINQTNMTKKEINTVAGFAQLFEDQADSYTKTDRLLDPVKCMTKQKFVETVQKIAEENLNKFNNS